MKYLRGKSDKKIFHLVSAMCVAYANRYTPGNLALVLPGHRDPECYGSCSKRGVIRIRIRWSKARGRKRLTAWEILDTIAHELAHLIDQKHSSAWFRKYAHILAIMAAEGCYERLLKMTKK